MAIHLKKTLTVREEEALPGWFYYAGRRAGGAPFFVPLHGLKNTYY